MRNLLRSFAYAQDDRVVCRIFQLKVRFIEQVRVELPPALRATSLNDGGFVNFVHKLFIHSKTLYGLSIIPQKNYFSVLDILPITL